MGQDWLVSIIRPRFITQLIDRRTKKQVVDSYLGEQNALAQRWVRSAGRPDNFYYGLTPRNTDHLISALAYIFATSREQVGAIAAELEQCAAVQEASIKLDIDPTRLYGRRLGWYVVTRLTHPNLVVETGVHDGIGAVILTEALRRNAAEGATGAYRGTDIDPKAGWLLQAPDVNAAVLYGDSIESLEKLDPASVDLFINDSDHSADYEYREYQVMTSRLSPHAVILGDNAHATDALMQYSRETGRDFIFFDERPADHWYPGAGVGISLSRNQQ